MNEFVRKSDFVDVGCGVQKLITDRGHANELRMHGEGLFPANVLRWSHQRRHSVTEIQI